MDTGNHHCGFVDLQVNGYLGVDFSEPGLTLDQVVAVTRTLGDRGTIAYCPTIITTSLKAYESNLPVLAQAARDPELGQHILGIHLEGPFISDLDGARGAHPLEHTRSPDIAFYERLRELAGDRVVLVTLAPELPGATDLISHIDRTGATVALGHHLADFAQIDTARRSGAEAVTHFGNGLPNLINRHYNPLWDQLAQPELKIMLITDGHHIPDSLIRVTCANRGPSGIIVVSDCAPIAGMAPGQYRTLGQEVTLEDSGRLWNPAENHLVGSSYCQIDCMNYLAGLEIFSEDELWRVGLCNPLWLLGREASELAELNGIRVQFRDGRFNVI